jgi:hypothetical protein
MKKPTPEEMRKFKEKYGEKFNFHSRRHRRWMKKIQDELPNRPNGERDRRYINFNGRWRSK